MLDRGLSATTVVQLHRILKQALSHAVKWGILTRNVADATTPPRIQRKQLEMWDVDTIHRFLDAARDSRYRDFYHLAILTGMRRSELTGLQWENVDLEAGAVRVVKTLQIIVGKGLQDGLPKTSRSRRSIALSPATVNLLHEIRGHQIEQSLAAADAWQNTGYVFTQADGRPRYPDEVTREFTRIVHDANLPHLTLHGLRHAHATLLLTAGEHPKVVSERLGPQQHCCDDGHLLPRAPWTPGSSSQKAGSTSRLWPLHRYGLATKECPRTLRDRASSEWMRTKVQIQSVEHGNII